MTKQYPTEISNAVAEALDSFNFPYSFQEKEGVFLFHSPIMGKIQSVNCAIIVMEDAIKVLGVYPVHADPENTKVMATMDSFLHLANYGMNCGNFEFDHSDGEIGFKTFVGCRSRVAPLEEFRRAIFMVGCMFSHFSEGILGVLFEGLSAEEAMEKEIDPLDEIREMNDELDQVLSAFESSLPNSRVDTEEEGPGSGKYVS